MKIVEKYIDINTATAICIRNGITIYPVVSGRLFKVQVNDNGKIINGNKEYAGKLVANAVGKAYKYYANKIIKQKENAKNA